MRSFAIVIATIAVPVALCAQDPVPSDVSFAVRRAFLNDLLTVISPTDTHTVGARWSAEMRLGDRSDVHALSADCELHVAARMPANRRLATPYGIVVEPPNLCQRRVPQISQTGSIASAWRNYFDQNVVNKPCTVTGFPRIFSEHATGGSSGGGSNPDHVIEVHPVTSMTCNGQTIDYTPLIRIFPGMRKISDESARACLEERRLFVRQRGSGDQIRYEFLEEGAKGSDGRCGNFVVADAHINKDYLRQTTNGGDHIALAQAWIGEDGPFPLKIYTYKGTPVDSLVAQLFTNPDEFAQLSIRVHGVLTYDYFTIAQAIQDSSFKWLPADQLKDFKEIRRPLSLVVFGRAEP